MQQKHLFEYAVIRVVPRVEREEFMNIGVIVFCAKQKFLNTLYLIDPARLLAFSPDLDLDSLTDNLCSFVRITVAGKDAGPIGKLDAASRFRWLTATRSTVLQSSKVHPGMTVDAEETLKKLFEQLVVC
jgi:hypothetical protein